MLDDERSVPVRHHELLGVARRVVERRDPLGGEELGHRAGSYRWWLGPLRSGAPTINRWPSLGDRRESPRASPKSAAAPRRGSSTLLDHEIERWRAVDAALEEPLGALRDLVLAGGKRLRPAFCHWAFVGAGGSPDDRRVVDAGCGARAPAHVRTRPRRRDGRLGHATRLRSHPRGRDANVTSGARGEASRDGSARARRSSSVIFAFVYADILFGEAPQEARQVFDELRVELCIGQYLDLVGTASGSSDPEQAERIERYKSGKYTVERPLHLGAALAGSLRGARRAAERRRAAAR